MARIINRREEAQTDLYNHATYIARDNLPAAERFLEAAEEAFERLAEMPGMGSVREYKDPALSGMRMWPIPGFTNYLIFYLATEDELEVLRVLHGAQNLNKIFSPK